MLIADFCCKPLVLRGAVVKVRRPVLACFAGSTTERVAVRCAVRALKRSVMDAVLDAIVDLRIEYGVLVWC